MQWPVPSQMDCQLILKRQLKQNQQMKSRCSSAPKMQTIYTPRVKDARQSHESPQKHYYGKTAPRFGHSNHNYFYNPENSPEKAKPATKVAQNNVEEIIAKKISVEPVLTQGLKQVKRVNTNNPPKDGKVNKQQTIHGRNLEYPAPTRLNNIPIRQELSSTQSVELMRSSSASSKHFVDRGIKSAAIKSRNEEFNQKFKVAFGYLLDTNEAYLAERRRACNQKARPKDEIFKIMRPYANTTNNDEFQKKEAVYAQFMQPQNQKTANSFGPRKVCGNSTTNELHNGKQGPKADLAQWPEGYKLQGPLYGVTTHANHFPHHGDYDKMVPVAKFNEHPLGMPHRTNSTHRTFHKGEHVDAAQLATWNNLHPYGNDFDPNRGTTYGHHHSDKEQQPIQQWPMYQPQLIRSDGKFTTEHKSNLVNHTSHELNPPNYCQCGRKAHRH